MTLFSAHIDADVAELAAGSDGILVWGGPIDADSTFPGLGTTLFFTQYETLEPWVITPSAAFFTVSIISPIEQETKCYCNWHESVLSCIQNSVIYPFDISSPLSPPPDQLNRHLPNYKKIQN